MQPPINQPPYPQELDALANEIHSATAAELASSSDALLRNIKEAHRKPSYGSIMLIVAVVLFCFMALQLGGLAMGHSSSYAIAANIVLWIAACVGFCTGHRYDVKHKILSIDYHLDKEIASEYNALLTALKALSTLQGLWRVTQVVNDGNWKYAAGAPTSVHRRSIIIAPKAPPFIATNVQPMCLNLGDQEWYFLPDRILVYQNVDVGSIAYSDLAFNDMQALEFVEYESVPRDAQVIRHEWQFVNKRGGPDRRFANNRQVPVCAYTGVVLCTKAGVNIRLMASNGNALEAFLAIGRSAMEIGVYTENPNLADKCAIQCPYCKHQYSISGYALVHHRVQSKDAQVTAKCRCGKTFQLDICQIILDQQMHAAEERTRQDKENECNRILASRWTGPKSAPKLHVRIASVNRTPGEVKYRVHEAVALSVCVDGGDSETAKQVASLLSDILGPNHPVQHVSVKV
jgi:hypothetical protein